MAVLSRRRPRLPLQVEVATSASAAETHTTRGQHRVCRRATGTSVTDVLYSHDHAVDGVGIRSGHSVVQFGATITSARDALPVGESGGATQSASTYRRIWARSLPNDHLGAIFGNSRQEMRPDRRMVKIAPRYPAGSSAIVLVPWIVALAHGPKRLGDRDRVSSLTNAGLHLLDGENEEVTDTSSPKSANQEALDHEWWFAAPAVPRPRSTLRVLSATHVPRMTSARCPK